MINLIEVSQKLGNILNGIDTEIPREAIIKRPHFLFGVKTIGVHMDTIADMKEGKNFIPVFVDSMGGSISPIPQLQEMDVSIPITFYFPIQFKDDFFTLAEYLANVFVGKVLNYGDHSGKCISNISPATYGEISYNDFSQFREWVKTNYKYEIDTTGVYMSMNINLYLTGFNGKDKYVLGNQVHVYLSSNFGYSQVYKEEITFANTSITGNNGTSVEQILGEKETTTLALTTSYAVPLEIYVKDNQFFKLLLNAYFKGNLASIDFELAMFCPIFHGQSSYIRHVMLTNASLNIKKGQPITFGFTLTKKKEIE